MLGSKVKEDHPSGNGFC